MLLIYPIVALSASTLCQCEIKFSLPQHGLWKLQ